MDFLRQRKGAYAVDYAEVDGFCTAAHERCYHLLRHVEDLCRRAAVYVVVAAESLDHVFIVCNVREDAQLNLRVVRINEGAARAGDEKAPHFAPKVCAHGDILQVGFCGAYAPRACFGLVKTGMYAPIRRYHF